MRWMTSFSILLVASAVVFAACTAEVEDEGELPEVDVDPAAVDVDVGRDTVTVPTIDIDVNRDTTS